MDPQYESEEPMHPTKEKIALLNDKARTGLLPGSTKVLLTRIVAAVPPQNPVNRAIVDVSRLGVKLAYPDASLAVRPACDRQITAKRLPHLEPSARM